MSDTIAAIATGNTLSAIGILRLSGPEALSVIDRVFSPRQGAPMSQRPNRKLVYGRLVDSAGNTLDWCLCMVSRGPESYTGEDTAELQCHGSPLVLRLGLEALFAAGARQALPGEFTKRAFLNGRMDLIQAEAIIDLIGAETEAAARNAAGQLSGAVSHRTDAIYDGLRDLSAHFHAVLDYPDEDIDPFSMESYSGQMRTWADDLNALLQSFDRGRVLNTGVPAALLGRPNVGKSSLLNALAGFERAIVTEIPGTTRDTLDIRLNIGGVPLCLTDTAGLRESADAVEQQGVERARAAAETAQLVLAVFDGSTPLTEGDFSVLTAAEAAPHAIGVINKTDLPLQLNLAPIRARLGRLCLVSAATGAGLEELSAAIAEIFGGSAPVPSGEILTNARQAEAVGRAYSALRSALAALEQGETPDIVLTEAEAAMSALGELTGRTVREDVTARIFERFCVGK